MEFPSQGSDPSHSCGEAAAATSGILKDIVPGRGIRPASQRSQEASDPVASQRDSRSRVKFLLLSLGKLTSLL